jgi:hypothetical protein
LVIFSVTEATKLTILICMGVDIKKKQPVEGSFSSLISNLKVYIFVKMHIKIRFYYQNLSLNWGDGELGVYIYQIILDKQWRVILEESKQ